jgi:hypothetical protein
MLNKSIAHLLLQKRKKKKIKEKVDRNTICAVLHLSEMDIKLSPIDREVFITPKVHFKKGNPELTHNAHRDSNDSTKKVDSESTIFIFIFIFFPF